MCQCSILNEEVYEFFFHVNLGKQLNFCVSETTFKSKIIVTAALF